jgi:hypothetical protein
MPVALAVGTDSSCALPALQLLAVDPVDGFLKDIDSGTFRIVDSAGTEVVAPTAIDILDCPTGMRLGTGRYVAPFVTATPLGIWFVEWTFKFTPAGADQTFKQEFEVLGSVSNPLAHAYTTVAAMRAAGVKASKIKAGALRDLIVLASAYVDMYTGRFFQPEAKTVQVDGNGARGLLLNEAIIALADISIVLASFEPSDKKVDPDSIRVYNRHLSEGLLDPDDRDNPKVEFFFHSTANLPAGSVTFLHDFVWTRGRQNIIVDGVFGFTDPPGPIGVVPPLIEQATKLLVMRNAPSLLDADKRQDTLNAWRLTELRTRDQQTKWAIPSGRGAAIGAFTGDPEIDTILARYTRPIQLGAT